MLGDVGSQIETQRSFLTPRALMTGCCGCPNFGSCRELKDAERKLEDAYSEPANLTKLGVRRIRILLDHLHRQRFQFPFVREFSGCWYQDKFGVIQSLIDHAQKLMKEKAA